MDLPRDKKIVGYKWVFTVKCRADGSIKRYKVRVVANDFIQTHGIAYLKTFSYIAKINPIQVLLSLLSRPICPYFNST